MNLEEIMAQTIEVALACGNSDCMSFERDETEFVCRFFNLVCGDCGTVIRIGDPLEAN